MRLTGVSKSRDVCIYAPQQNCLLRLEMLVGETTSCRLGSAKLGRGFSDNEPHTTYLTLSADAPLGAPSTDISTCDYREKKRFAFCPQAQQRAKNKVTT
jgi:hypothetical protein